MANKMTMTRRSCFAWLASVGALMLSLAGSAASQTVHDDAEYFLVSGGIQRRYIVHTPPRYDGKIAFPVMLGFHGRGPGAESLRRQSEFNDVADEHDFIMVYPDGTGPKFQHSWNSGPHRPNYASENNIDDVGFVHDLLDALPTMYAIDTTRIYATGMSNGSSMCHRLGIEMSHRIAAIGTVSGLLAIREDQPPNPVPVMHFHGMQDPLVPFREVARTIRFWKQADHCRIEPVSVETMHDRIEYDFAPWPGHVGAPVVLYALPQGGHTWPGGVDVSAGHGTGNLVATVPASRLIWRFCRQFRRSP